MLALLRSEMFRFSRWMTPRLLAGILVAFTFATYFLLLSAIQSPTAKRTAGIAQLKDQIRFDQVPVLGISLVHQIGVILLVILAARIVAGEFSWGTIRTVLPRASSRVAYLSSKFLVLVLFAVVLTVVGYLGALAGSAAVTALGGLNGAVSSDFATRSLVAVGHAIYCALPYIALTFMAALITRSSGAAIGIGLGAYFLESILISLLINTPLKDILRFLPGMNVSALLRVNTGGSAVTAALPDPWQAAGVLAAYIIGFLAVAYWYFQTRDVTVGGAE